MDVYIAKLRKYLKLDDNEILNIHGEGFRLVVKTKRKIKKKLREIGAFFLGFSLFVQQKINLQSLI
jgi:hypothetical protein